jgi:hypothetical protein
MAARTELGRLRLLPARGWSSRRVAMGRRARPERTRQWLPATFWCSWIAGFDRLVGPIERGEADFVIGSRLRGTREQGSMLPSQILAGWMVGWLLWITQRVRYTDMGPFRAIRRTSLEQLQMAEMTYGWNLEMQVKACQHGLRIVEIPVDYRRRFAGVSKVSGNFSASIRAAARILGVLFRIGLSRQPKR